MRVNQLAGFIARFLYWDVARATHIGKWQRAASVLLAEHENWVRRAASIGLWKGCQAADRHPPQLIA